MSSLHPFHPAPPVSSVPQLTAPAGRGAVNTRTQRQPFARLAALAALALPGMVLAPMARADQPGSPGTGAPAAVVEDAPAFRKPPQEIVDILDAPALPAVQIDPQRRWMVLLDPVTLPPLEDLAAPMLRLAGSRINPANRAPHGPRRYSGLALKSLVDGADRAIDLPDDANVGVPSWAPDGSRFAFTLTRPDRVELWLHVVDDGDTRRLTGRPLNGVYGPGFAWLSDSRTLVAGLVPENPGPAPEAPATPPGPVVQETAERSAPILTFQDMLGDPHDEALFEHYFQVQLAILDSDTGALREIGGPDLHRDASPSPDGRHLLVTRTRRPFSYFIGSWAFPQSIEIWDLDGKLVRQLAELPLRDDTPRQGVPVGPRSHTWQNNAPATLVWVEALDGGDPLAEAEHRDRALRWQAGSEDAEPVEWLRTEHRFAGVTWLGGGEPRALVREFDRDRRWSRSWLYHAAEATADRPAPDPRLVWDHSAQDRYNDPGNPVMRRNEFGAPVALVHEQSLLLRGDGATPEGDRPFLDRLDLTTLETERLWACEGEMLESVTDLLADDASRLLLRHESPTDPPNYFILDRATGERTRWTRFADPAPQLREIHRQLVVYERQDGVPLSATLYLPPGAREGEPLPLLVWAYPREFSDPAMAGQISGSPHAFTRIGGSSHLFALTQGYAVMHNATMPVIGDPETMNDTFIEQIVAGAAAAIDYAVGRGVADRERVAVGGHSYGAFMTANLLAHSDLFRAGIARSGAYNRTLTPFGFQSERRSLWEAPESYFRLSPFMHADKIRAPLLILHGAMDNNAGTYPMQSERLFRAIQGNGGTARMVMLPHESHGYVARESVLHALAEMIGWLDMHVRAE